MIRLLDKRLLVGILVLCLAVVVTVQIWPPGPSSAPAQATPSDVKDILGGASYQPRKRADASGYTLVFNNPKMRWPADATLTEISKYWQRAGHGLIEGFDQFLARPDLPPKDKINFLLGKASLHNYESEPVVAYQTLEKAR